MVVTRSEYGFSSCARNMAVRLFRAAENSYRICHKVDRCHAQQIAVAALADALIRARPEIAQAQCVRRLTWIKIC